jgi:hypothetical protein
MNPEDVCRHYRGFGGVLAITCLCCGGAFAPTGNGGVDASPDASLDGSTIDGPTDAARGVTTLDAAIDGAPEAEASACEPGLTSCAGVCTNTSTDPTHCGSCGHMCTAPANAEPTCTAGQCGYSCDADAGLSNCSGTCTDVTSDPNNCGACGKACTAGPTPACASGSCYYAILTASAEGPESIATDGKNVYWTFSEGTPSCLGSVFSCSVAEGCAGSPVSLASGLTFPGPIATDGVNVYWGGGGGCAQSTELVESCPVSGCAGPPTVLASLPSVAEIASVATDGKNVYWADSSQSVYECAVTGCDNNPTLLYLSERTPLPITTDGVNVYWLDGNLSDCDVLACAVGGCPGGPTTLAADQENQFSIATDGVNVYWNGFDTLSSCPVSGCPGGPKIVASAGSAGAVGSVVTDGVSFYFADYPSMSSPVGSILACPVSGCVVPANLSPPRYPPTQIVTTNASPYVFWSANLALLREVPVA